MYIVHRKNWLYRMANFTLHALLPRSYQFFVQISQVMRENWDYKPYSDSAPKTQKSPKSFRGSLFWFRLSFPVLYVLLFSSFQSSTHFRSYSSTSLSKLRQEKQLSCNITFFCLSRTFFLDFLIAFSFIYRVLNHTMAAIHSLWMQIMGYLCCCSY